MSAMGQETATDMLIFLDTPVGQHAVLWTGAWPPPPRMVVVMQNHHGNVGVVTEPEYVTGERLRKMAGTTLCVHYFRLRNASAITHAALPGEHWFRGAEYVAEQEACIHP